MILAPPGVKGAWAALGPKSFKAAALPRGALTSPGPFNGVHNGQLYIMKHASYLRGAVLLTLGGLAAKVIGVLYRIPLANLLGGYGMGLYQMAYPLFCVLLTFTSAGIPSALSCVIAQERARRAEDGGTARAALRLFGVLGLVGSVGMALLALPMSGLQGDESLVSCYFLLAPAVLLVALLAVLRGYFQGCGDMAPTAVSELVEQAVKAGVGLLLAYEYRGDPARATAFALFGVTLSEAVALLVLLLRYRRERHDRFLRARRIHPVSLLSPVLPVMAAGALLPLSQMLDCVLVVRLLRVHTAEAVAQYGLFSGGAVALYSLPATAAYGFAAAAVPEVSRAAARGDAAESKSRALTALMITLLLTLPCALGLALFADFIVRLLYPSLSAGDAALLVRLVRMTAVSAVLLSGTETLAACLTGMGRAKYAALSMLVAVVCKAVCQLLLVSDPAFGIAGAAISADVCFLIAFFMDLYYTVRKTKERAYDHSHQPRDSARGVDPQRAKCTSVGGRGVHTHGGRTFLKDA